MLFKIELVYCAAWNYTDRAVSTIKEIMADKDLENQIESFNLVPSDGGRFELSVNDDLIFSKKQLGRHAEEGEVIAVLRKYIAEVKWLRRRDCWPGIDQRGNCTLAI